MALGIILGAIGSAIGSAIGGAIGGSLFGIAASTIGAGIGLAVAGGVTSVIKGGDFWDGFVAGGVGALVGGIASNVFGGATGSAGSLAQDTMLMDQLSGFENIGDITGELGWGDVSTGISGEIGTSASALAEAGAPMGEYIPYDEVEMDAFMDQLNKEPLTGSEDFYLPQDAKDLGSNNWYTPENIQQLNAEFPQGTGLTSGSWNESPFSFEMSSSANSTGMTPTLSDGGMTSSPYSGTLEGMSASPVETGMASTQATPATGQPINVMEGATTAPTTNATTAATVPASGGFMNTAKNALGKSDAFLRDLFKMPKTSPGSPTLGLANSLFDSYQKYGYAKDMDKQISGMAPLSYENYLQKAYNPTNYRTAAANMARSGRTGVLPILMARMNSAASQNYYNNYLPERSANYSAAKSQVEAAKRNAFNSPGNYLASMYSWGAK